MNDVLSLLSEVDNVDSSEFHLQPIVPAYCTDVRDDSVGWARREPALFQARTILVERKCEEL
jgi:hypothetical protein